MIALTSCLTDVKRVFSRNMLRAKTSQSFDRSFSIFKSSKQ